MRTLLRNAVIVGLLVFSSSAYGQLPISTAMGTNRELHAKILLHGLGLSASQTARVKDITYRYAAKLRVVEGSFPQGDVPLSAAQVQQVKDLRRLEMSEIMTVLTPSQRADYATHAARRARDLARLAEDARRVHAYRDSVKRSRGQLTR